MNDAPKAALERDIADFKLFQAAMDAVPSEAFARYTDGAKRFVRWFESYDPQACTTAEVIDALGALVGHFPLELLAHDQPPTTRFKPTTSWQAQRRKALRLPIDGYATAMVPNADDLPSTECSLAYDLCDFGALASAACEGATDTVRGLLLCHAWPYVERRIHACRAELPFAAKVPRRDPFRMLEIRGRPVRFVGWRTGATTHATRDVDEGSGATTLCGGRLAFHKHTHQQWASFACEECRAAVDGKRAPEPLFRAVSPELWRFIKGV